MVCVQINLLSISNKIKELLFKKAPMVSQKGQDIFTKDAEKEYRRLNQFVMTLNHPIDLTESEYRKYKSLDEFRKAAFLKEIDKSMVQSI